MQIDTTQIATDAIDYVATDAYGNTATFTRTVLIESIAPANTMASTTEATSTAQ